MAADTPTRWPWIIGGVAALAVANVVWSGYRQTRQELDEDCDEFLRQLSDRRPRRGACRYWLGLPESTKRDLLARFFAARASTFPQSRPLEEAVEVVDARCYTSETGI